MPTELQAHAVREKGMRFRATTGGHGLTLDYPLTPDEPTAGPTPLETLLTCLAVCSGSTVGLVLDRMKQPVSGLEVDARALRSDEHPTVLTAISLEFEIRGAGVEAEAVGRALHIAEAQLCPIWAMLKPGTPITASFKLVE
jgi:putative redox protein